MARRGGTTATRWVTKLVNRGGKQFRQRYKVAVKAAKKLGKRVAKRAKAEARDFKKARAGAAKKRAAAKTRAGARKQRQQERKQQQPVAPAKPKTKPAWREIVVEGRRKWLRISAGKSAQDAGNKLAALRAMKERKAAAPEGLGKWQKPGGDNRHRKHKDYAAPHRPKPRRQG